MPNQNFLIISKALEIIQKLESTGLIDKEEADNTRESLASNPQYAYDIFKAMRDIDNNNSPKLKWWQSTIEAIGTIHGVVNWLTKHGKLLNTLQEEDQLKVHTYINKRLDKLKEVQ